MLIKVKTILTFQLKVWSCTARQCHFWPKQSVKSSRRWTLPLTTAFLFCCRGNSSRNNRIMANTHEKLILIVFSYKCSSKAFLERLHLVRCFSVWLALYSVSFFSLTLHPLWLISVGGRGSDLSNQSLERQAYLPKSNISLSKHCCVTTSNIAKYSGEKTPQNMSRLDLGHCTCSRFGATMLPLFILIV